MNEGEKQERSKGFVEREVFVCQSMLVDEMLKRGIFLYDDISNPQVRDIFEWWVV